MVAADSLAAQFDAAGFASGIRILDQPAAAELRRRFDALEAVEGPDRCQIGLLDRHFDQRFVWKIATHPTILNNVEAILGPDLLLLATHFFCKYPAEATGNSRQATDEALESNTAASRPSPVVSEPSEPRFVAWHQDVTYWGLEPPHSITAWYAVDDSDVENGCMRVIPATHRGGIREHGKSDRTGNLLSINQEAPVTAEEEARAVDLVLRAGEISLHHGMLIHGSNSNRSSRRRCGLTLRYVTPSVRQVDENSLRRPWTAILVRGADRYHHFGERPAPF